MPRVRERAIALYRCVPVPSHGMRCHIRHHPAVGRAPAWVVEGAGIAAAELLACRVRHVVLFALRVARAVRPRGATLLEESIEVLNGAPLVDPARLCVGRGSIETVSETRPNGG